MKITLAQVERSQAAVRFSCNDCQHTSVVPVARLIRHNGADTRLDELEGKAFCTRCGSRQIDCRPEYPRAPGSGGIG